MKIYVVKIPEDGPVLWGHLNEAVIRAETPEQAKEALIDSWLISQWPTLQGRRISQWADSVQVAELLTDGPAGIVSGTAMS